MEKDRRTNLDGFRNTVVVHRVLRCANKDLVLVILDALQAQQIEGPLNNTIKPCSIRPEAANELLPLRTTIAEDQYPPDELPGILLLLRSHIKLVRGDGNTVHILQRFLGIHFDKLANVPPDHHGEGECGSTVGRKNERCHLRSLSFRRDVQQAMIDKGDGKMDSFDLGLGILPKGSDGLASIKICYGTKRW